MAQIKVVCQKCRASYRLREGAVSNASCQQCGCDSVAFHPETGHKYVIAACAACGKSFHFLSGDYVKAYHDVPNCKSFLLTLMSSPSPSKTPKGSHRVKYGGKGMKATEDSPSVTAIILCHNQLNHTRRCVASVEASDVPLNVVLVDNASSDGTEQWARKKAKGDHLFTYVRNQINLGCAIARNQGAKWATGDYLLFLDNDQFIQRDLVTKMLAMKADIVGVEAWRISSKLGTVTRTNVVVDRRVYVGSGGMLILRERFFALGGYDERYAPAWYADSDFCMRARVAGMGIALVTGTHVEHVHGATISKQRSFDSERAKQRSGALFSTIWGDYLYSGQGEPKQPMPPVDRRLEHSSMNLDMLTRVVKNARPPFDKAVLKWVVGVREPLLTVALLNWKRLHKLMRTLDSLYESTSFPINICLRVQGAAELGKSDKQLIEESLKRFHAYHLTFTDANHGTAGPRAKLVARARTRFNTRYIMLLDDDMILPKFGCEVLVSFLEQSKEHGAASLAHTRMREEAYIKGGSLCYTKFSTQGESVKDVQLMGSATMVIRDDVWGACQVDSGYYIGLWDYDLCMQMRQEGWKLAIITLNRLLAVNDGGGPPDYTDVRHNKETINDSKLRFKEKWGAG